MPLIDMKRAMPERKEGEPYPEPLYPWGLQLNFNDEVLERLGLGTEDFKIGQEFPFEAVVRVTGVSAHENTDERRESVELQVVQIAKYDTGEDRATKLFGGKEPGDAAA